MALILLCLLGASMGRCCIIEVHRTMEKEVKTAVCPPVATKRNIETSRRVFDFGGGGG